MSYTINQIQDEMNAAGSHWWDRGTMRSFGCRVSDEVYQGPGGIYFVSSEKSYGGSRQYTVRQYSPVRKSVETIGEFCSYTRYMAHKIAKEMASTPLQDQFDDAMCALDRAVTGNDKSGSITKYGTIEDARECGSRGILYLSDGGYTRVAVKQYDDSSGYYLSVIPTWKDETDNDGVRSRFSNAYKLQSEVCRVLSTDPAGEDAKVTKAIHKPTDAVHQLQIDIERLGGKSTITQCRKLMKLATDHHKMMEDYCNGTDIYDEEGEPLPPLHGLRRNLIELASDVGMAGVVFSGDPRGCTVKLVTPDGSTNDWGKEGWCIPAHGE
jgi:hypothetical protein